MATVDDEDRAYCDRCELPISKVMTVIRASTMESSEDGGFVIDHIDHVLCEICWAITSEVIDGAWIDEAYMDKMLER
jgi:hypothetical protein